LSSGFGGGLRAEVLEGFDESFDELFENVAAAVPCVPEKDAAFLRWHYGPGSPQFPVTVLAVKEGETLLGYAVLMVTSTGQDGNVLDLTTLPDRRDTARALLRESVRSFRRAGVQIVRYRFLESPTSPRSSDLRQLGFFTARGGAIACSSSSRIPACTRWPTTPPTGHTPWATAKVASGRGKESVLLWGNRDNQLCFEGRGCRQHRSTTRKSLPPKFL